MKFELKSVKYAAFNSQETYCFEAVLYIDGKRAFGVSNNGHGGPDDYYSVDNRSGGDVFNWVREINAELFKEIIVFESHSTRNDLEMVVGGLMNDWLNLKEVKKHLKKITWADGEDIYNLPAEWKPTAENLKKIQAAKWWKKSFVLLNNMSPEETMKYLNEIRT